MPSPTDAPVSQPTVELSVGEMLYHQYREQIHKEHPSKGDIAELELMVRMIQEYCIDEMPANDQGQITFQRAVFESVQACLKAAVERFRPYEQISVAMLGELGEAVKRLEKNEFPYIARGNQGRVWMHHQKSSDLRTVFEQFMKLLPKS